MSPDQISLNHKKTVSFPIDLIVRDGDIFVVQADIPRVNLTDPFLLDSLTNRFNIATVNKIVDAEQLVLVRPLHYNPKDERIVFTPVTEFISQHERIENVSDKLNFIFHMSRCGSTLVSQMLATVHRFYVISESTAINAALNPKLILPSNLERTQLISALVHAMYKCKPDSCERVLIKFRSWNTLFLDVILDTFPMTPWIFVSRRGCEVLESVLRDPPGWMRGRLAHKDFFSNAINVPVSDLIKMSDAEFGCRLLGVFCKNAANHRSSRSMFLHYESIKDGVTNLLNDAWNLKLTPKEKADMVERTNIYSKDVDKVSSFKPDGKSKCEKVGKEGRNLANLYTDSERENLYKDL